MSTEVSKVSATICSESCARATVRENKKNIDLNVTVLKSQCGPREVQPHPGNWWWLRMASRGDEWWRRMAFSGDEWRRTASKRAST